MTGSGGACSAGRPRPAAHRGSVVTNALNLLDNMDGLASGVAAMSALAFFGISAYESHYLVGALAVALAGVLWGSSPNFPPARVFLGDAGSLLVGFLLAAIGLNLDLIGQAGVIRSSRSSRSPSRCSTPTLVVIARFRDGRPVLRGGTDHTSHRLAARASRTSRSRLSRSRAGGLLAPGAGTVRRLGGNRGRGDDRGHRACRWCPAGHAPARASAGSTGEIGSDDLIEIPQAEPVVESTAAVDGLGILNAGRTRSMA